MKYLLVLAVLLVAFYIWRHNRESEARDRAEEAARKAPPKPPAPPAAMTTCRHCGLHLPASEAVRGILGDYCGQAHRRLGEG
jgi:uncharacterized protein